MLLMMLLMRIILRMIIQTSIIPAMTLSIMTTHTRTLRLWILQRRITQTLTPNTNEYGQEDYSYQDKLRH